MSIREINKIKLYKLVILIVISFTFFNSLYAQTYSLNGVTQSNVGQTDSYIFQDSNGNTLGSGHEYFWTTELSATFTESSSSDYYAFDDPDVSVTWGAVGQITLQLEVLDIMSNYYDGDLMVTVSAAPPSTPTAPTIQSTNCGNTVLQRGTPPSGVTWYWQSSTSDTSTSNSATTITLTSGSIYYLRARNSSGTWSTNSSSVSYTINQASTWYADTDADTLGDPNNTTLACSQPSGYVSNSNDLCPLAYGTVANNGCPLGCDYEDINRIISKTYKIDGTLVGHSKAYFNTLGKAIQTQSLDIKTDSVWASNTLYDNHGRPAFQSLSAPINDTDCILYNPNFIKNSSNNNYNTSDFETSPEAPSTVGTATNFTLGRYYSTNNTSEPYQDITSYPFSRTIYSTLNPGSVKKVIGGNKVSVNGSDEWAQGYSFTMPVAQELHYAFGPDFFPKQKVVEKNCNYPSGNYTGNDYVYDIIPIDIETCTTDSQGVIYGVEIDDPTVEYQIDDIFLMSTNYDDGYYQIQNRTIVTNSNQILDYAGMSCGPYTSCSDAYILADYIKTTKTVVRDVHGIETVVFTDSDGNTLAAARSGDEDGNAPSPYSIVSPINEQGFVDIHIPVGCGGTITFEGPGSAVFKIYDLVSESIVTSSTSGTHTLNPGMYRIEETTTYHKNPLPYVEINGGTIALIDDINQVGVRHNVNYYDYSLNFYDKTGRLTQSVQPEGFDDALTLSTSTRNHNLTSTYSYNSLGQLLDTSSPDEGTADFKYRTDGQIRYSQNSIQATASPQEFSYTNYDDYGRPIESGIIENSTFNTADPDSTLPSGTTKEQHVTVYDQPDITGLHAALNAATIATSNYPSQKFVAGNVSKTYTQNPSTTTTWYSYDVLGRVEWIVQDIDGLGTKTIDYNYDVITGAVTKVDYQRYKSTERFIHRYNYNIANELVSVETSLDDATYTLQESYEYFETGTLKRKELLGGVQGTDYVYNINGQLKAINHPSLSSANDPGGDTDDAFGMLIDYHQNDYARTERSNITSTTVGTDQLNGNIKTTRWNTYSNALIAPKENAYNYQYNKNNWLEDATYGEHVIGSTYTNIDANVSSTAVTAASGTLNLEATNSITLSPGFHAQQSSNFTAKIVVVDGFNEVNTGDYNVSGITYDANGNIKTLKRNKNTESASNAMDDFTYNYKTGKNQLDHVADAITTTTNADDLKTQTAGNYTYNSIGQLTQSNENGGIINYTYNASGLVTEITKNSLPLVKFFYNDKGHRVRKDIYSSGGSLTDTDHYVRDAAGSVMAIYRDNVLTEQPIYGASRIGIYNRQDNSTAYQLTDHLGNVRAVIAKDGNNNMLMLSYTDYYPFGMPMPNRNVEGNYRYGYQGEFAEKDPETGLNAFELRMWDSRIGRWLSPDPYNQYFSPYLGMGNNPISMIDPDGGFSCDDCPEGTFADGTEHIGADGGTYIYDAEIGRWSDSAAVTFTITKNQPKAPAGQYAQNLAIAMTISNLDGGLPTYMDAAALGVGIGLTANTAYHSMVDAFTPDYTITSEPELPYITLYRGVHAGHPAYTAALNGTAVPWALGPVGHNSPEAHNGGNYKSVFTSWTMFRTVADYHANKHNTGMGVVLMKRFRINQVMISPGDALSGEGEYLVPGVVNGASVQLPLGKGNPTGF